MKWGTFGAVVFFAFATGSATCDTDTPMMPPEQSSINKQQESESPSWGVGFAGGASSGVGFAIRRYFGIHSLQSNFFMLYQPVTYAETGGGSGHDMFGSIGLTYAQYLKKYNWAALRAVAASSVFYFDNSAQDLVGDCSTEGVCNYVTHQERDTNWFTGGGIGLEMNSSRNGISVSLDLLLNLLIDGNGFGGVYPIPQLSILYNF